jgi:hypothetical protein
MSTYFKDESDNPTSSSDDKNSIFYKISVYYQALMDKIQYYKKERWIAVAVLGFFYLLRIAWTKGRNII